MRGVRLDVASHSNAEYERWVEQPMPHEWRESVELDHIQRAGPRGARVRVAGIVLVRGGAALFVVDFRGDTVTNVQVDG